MAQLYKMTLYVCDLEDNLSLDGIETLIEQNALNGMFANCICHFADSQIGQNVGWDDAIDLNRCGCPTSAWDKYFAPPTKEKTNADHIRAMSDEELAEFLSTKLNDDFYDWPDLTLQWLQQPAEGGLTMANEKRLIDAYALEKAIRTDYFEHFTQYHDTDQIALIDMVCDDIEEAPTIDAVPVVRCRDCKHRDGTPGQPNIDCWQMHDDDFCSYGERKDGADNG